MTRRPRRSGSDGSRAPVERLPAIIEAAPDAIIGIDGEQRIMLFNRAACEAFGWNEQEALGQPLSMLLPPADRAAHPGKVAAFAAESPEWRQMSADRPRLTGLRKDGSEFPVEVTISKVCIDGEWQFTAIVRDISERQALMEELRNLSLYDALTSLPNRLLLSESLTASLRNLHPGAAVSVLFIDVDRFKRINDALGHVAGDALLTQFAARLLANTRARDTVARFGGDEFVVLAECEPDSTAAMGIAGRLRQAWCEPFTIDGQSITVTASIGISIARSSDVSHDTLLRDADVALYRAKELGRNRIEMFDPASGGWAATRLDLERGLEDAVRRGEFEVHYQPVVTMADNTVTGFEALLRWNFAGRLVPPCEFIPVAEETGQICGIGSWVLEQACRQALRFAEEAGRDVDMAVNLSLRQVTAPGLAAEVADVLERTGLPPHCLILEITETVMLHDHETTLATLHALRALGVHLALDDFGTGYSSLSHLRQVPVTTVKIDRSFMAHVTTFGSEDHSIVSGVVALAHAMGLTVIAEGIETGAQASTVFELGADRGQGYLYARPLPPTEAMHLLTRQPARRPSAAVPAARRGGTAGATRS
jgi:diguanylate cyclase (GGDEF)-like protein/PAS domain S-box-containing protein